MESVPSSDDYNEPLLLLELYVPVEPISSRPLEARFLERR
jgi:hypothetical protein